MKNSYCKLIFALILSIGFSLVSCAQEPKKPSAEIDRAALLGKFTEADIAKLKWIEGTWRGTGSNQPAFFERYRFEGTTLFVETFTDESMSNIGDASIYVLSKDGEFGKSKGDNRSAASIINDTIVQFVPVKGKKNSYRFEKNADGTWRAIIDWPVDGNTPARKIIYKMEPWPKGVE